MRKIFNLFLYVTLFISSAVATGGCSSDVPRENDSVIERDFSDDFYQELQRVGKIDFAKMTVTKTVTTDRTDWYKIGKRVAVYSFDIYLRASMDLEKIRPENIAVDEGSKEVSLTLPPIEVEIIGRSPEMRCEYENVGIFRSHPGSKERADLKEKANADFIREFKGNPEYKRQLTETAERKARLYFESLGEAAGYVVIFNQPLSIKLKNE